MGAEAPASPSTPRILIKDLLSASDFPFMVQDVSVQCNSPGYPIMYYRVPIRSVPFCIAVLVLLTFYTPCRASKGTADPAFHQT